MRKLLLAFLAALTLGSVASAQITDDNWLSMGDYPGLNGVVKAAVWHGSTLYVGGDFSIAGNVAASHVAKWDGERWSALGAGINGQVNTLLCDGSGNLYVGGDFTAAGEVAASRVAKWDGAKWSALGLGLNATVNALRLDNAGNLYVGGDFTTAGEIAASRVALWDGAKWAALGIGMDGAVLALARDSVGNLYAGGSFNTAGGVAVNHVAKWDGAAWSNLGVGMEYPLAPEQANVSALACDAANNLYAGGVFTTAGRVEADFVAKWDGLVWGSVAAGMDGQVRALGFDNSGNLYAGGAFAVAGYVFANSVARWDGAAWEKLGSGVDGEVNAVAFDFSGNLYVGGDFTSAGGKVAPNIAKCKVDAPVQTYTVTFVAGDGGSISGDTPQTVVIGGDCTPVTAVPATGHDFATWDHGYGAANPLTVTAVDTDLTITASFAKKTYTVHFVADVGGSIQGEATQVVEFGGSCLPVTAVPDSGHSFTTWDKGFGTANPLTVANVTADLTVVASFALKTYTVSFLASAGGVIVGEPTQTVQHGGSCSSVMAFAGAGNNFSTWDNGFGATNPLTVTDVTANMTITATFVKQTFTVVFAALPGGSIVGDTTQVVEYGADCLPVTADPDTGHAFTTWDKGYGTANPLTVTNVTSDLAITASFAKRTFTVAFLAGEGGQVTGDTLQTVEYGADCAPVTAVPDATHNFVAWSGGATANPLTVTNVTSDLTITANFALQTYTVRFVAGNGGSIAGEATQVVVRGGDCSAVTATPYAGRHFTTWDNGYGTTNPLTVTNVTGDLTIAASFELNVYTVVFAVSGNGSLTGETTQQVTYGESCSAVTAVASVNYRFSTWDNGYGTTNPLTVSDVTSDLNITATFVKKDHPEFHVARGSVFTVAASDVGLTSFAKKPKVAVSGGGKAKVLGFKRGAESVTCEWRGKDAPGTYSLMANGTMVTAEFYVEKPTVTTLSAYAGNAGDKIVVTGKFLGSKAPKLRMVYAAGSKVRKVRCVVAKPYNYANAQGKAGKSVMDVGTGASTLTFTVPRPITTAVPATLLLDSNSNYIEIKFNTVQ